MVSSLSPDPVLGVTPGCRSSLTFKHKAIENKTKLIVSGSNKQISTRVCKLDMPQVFRPQKRWTAHITRKNTYSVELGSQPSGTSGSGKIFITRFLNKLPNGSGPTLLQYCCCSCSLEGKAWWMHIRTFYSRKYHIWCYDKTYDSRVMKDQSFLCNLQQTISGPALTLHG